MAFLFHSKNKYFLEFAQHENFVSSPSIDYIFNYFQCCSVCSILINNWRVVCSYVKHTNRHNANDKRSQLRYIVHGKLFTLCIQNTTINVDFIDYNYVQPKMYGPFYWKSYFVSSISDAHNINHSFWKWNSFLCNGFIIEWVQTKVNRILYRKKDPKQPESEKRDNNCI